MVGLVVVTIAERRALAERLAADWPGAQLVVDPERHLIRNHVRAWRVAAALGRSWAMVVQDDVVPCLEWRERTYDRLDEADRLGYEAVTFYSAWPRARAELERGRRWLRIPPRRFRNEQAVAMRLALAADYAAHADQFITGLPTAWHDVALADFLAARCVSVWATLPSLVDHRLDVPSTVGHPRRVYGRERRSSTWHPEAR